MKVWSEILNSGFLLMSALVMPCSAVVRCRHGFLFKTSRTFKSIMSCSDPPSIEWGWYEESVTVTVSCWLHNSAKEVGTVYDVQST